MVVRAAISFCGLLLFTASAAAAELRTLHVDRKQGHILVKSETYFDAPLDAVFSILADYDGFERISKTFTEAYFLERDEAGNGTVYSRAEGCVLFFCTKIERVEELTLIPGREIITTAIPERSDVDYSVARWLFEPEGTGTRVMYDIEFKPSFWIPPVLGPVVLRSKLRKRGRQAAIRIEELANAIPIYSGAP